MWRKRVLISIVWILACMGTSAGQAKESILFRTENLTVPFDALNRCLQVGVFLSYRGSESRDWSVVNATLSYSSPHGLLRGAPTVQFISAEMRDDASPASAAGPGAGDACGTSEVLNGNALRQTPAVFFSSESSTLSVSERVNPMTRRIELSASASDLLFSTPRGDELLLAVITFPLAGATYGSLQVSFLPDSLIRDGNVLVDSAGNRLTAFTLDGDVEIKAPWYILSSRQWGLITSLAGLLAGLGALLRFRALGRVEASSVGSRRWVWLAILPFCLLSSGLVSFVTLKDSDEQTDQISEPVGRPTYGPATPYQLDLGEIRIPGAHRWERRLPEVSVDAAVNYLELGNQVWKQKYKCVGCHTTGTYLLVRPMLTSLGPPPSETREFVLSTFRPHFSEETPRVLMTGHRSAQVVYAAAGLSSWDRYVTGKVDPETDQMLRLMFRVQSQAGDWNVPACWPPLQSNSYQLATVGALAVALAPGWEESIEDQTIRAGVQRLRTLLRTSDPPHDYARVWLLWAGSRLEGLIDRPAVEELVDMIWDKQRSDGGWSLRSFAGRDQWGDGSRVEKLAAEREFYFPESDGHMTGLALIALRAAGVSPVDPRILRAVNWLERNQRASGRWWTASLNTEQYHLITYSATCFALLSLWECNVLSRPNP
ncbi:MAG: terpene cyclase/mutase family protein [Acidobacteriota bacterium]|nr:MAG: terpene cyclase/mutase family protein [Acidobacteriota bacterium]